MVTKTTAEHPTHDRVLLLFDYDPLTGLFTNRKSGYVHKVRSRHYSHINIDGKTYGAHRIAWYCMTGEWPTMVIDHINRDPGDNRFSNLRHVTVAVNSKNRTIKNRRVSKYRGVIYISRAKFSATVRHNNKTYYLGRFNTAYNAHRAYEKKLSELLGDDYVDIYFQGDINYDDYLKISKPVYLDSDGNPLKRTPKRKLDPVKRRIIKGWYLN